MMDMDQLKALLDGAERGSVIMFGPSYPYIEKRSDGEWQNGFFGMPDPNKITHFIPAAVLREHRVRVTPTHHTPPASVGVAPAVDGYHCLPWPPRSKDERTLVVKGRRVPNKAYTDWKKAVALWMKSLGVPCYPKGSQLRLDWIFVVPDLRARDLFDNAISGTLDAGKGVLWHDDCMFWDGAQHKQLDRTLDAPRLWFRVTPIDAAQQYEQAVNTAEVTK